MAGLGGERLGRARRRMAWFFSFTTGVQAVQVSRRSSRESGRVGASRGWAWRCEASRGFAGQAGVRYGEAGFFSSIVWDAGPFESGRGVPVKAGLARFGEAGQCTAGLGRAVLGWAWLG
jgi:hypothetical protein